MLWQKVKLLLLILYHVEYLVSVVVVHRLVLLGEALVHRCVWISSLLNLSRLIFFVDIISCNRAWVLHCVVVYNQPPVGSYGSPTTIIQPFIAIFCTFWLATFDFSIAVFRTRLTYSVPTHLARISRETSSVSRRTMQRWSWFLSAMRPRPGR
jgi:hypothetical protein